MVGFTYTYLVYMSHRQRDSGPVPSYL